MGSQATRWHGLTRGHSPPIPSVSALSWLGPTSAKTSAPSICGAQAACVVWLRVGSQASRTWGASGWTGSQQGLETQNSRVEAHSRQSGGVEPGSP